MKKAIKVGVLSAAALFVLFFAFSAGKYVQSRTDGSDFDIAPIASSAKTIAEPPSKDEIFRLVNEYRQSQGVKPLQFHGKLQEAAAAKCNDMAERRYWSHNTPDGQEPWIFLDQVGYRYIAAGENIAAGQTKAEHVVYGWRNSPGHNENLVQNSFGWVGYAVCYAKNGFDNSDQPTYMIVQFLAAGS